MKKVIYLLTFPLIMLLGVGCEKEELLEQDAQQEEILLKSTFQTGTHDGFYWSRWLDTNTSGTVNYTNGHGGNYNVTWNMTRGNFTAGKGWHSGSATRRIGYNIGIHQHTGGGGSVAYYGWSRNPLMEYYVNERWGPTRPTGTLRGTVTTDGHTYDIFTATRTNAPSIDGTRTFTQIFSTRRTMAPIGQNRTITFANHFNAWRNVGFGLGSDLNIPAIMVSEAWGSSSGRVNLTIWAQ